MLLIPCPHCGPRDEDEFVCGGQSHIDRPGPPEIVTDDAWADYLYYRDNPLGIQFERWRHAFGCGEWFNVARDTKNHRIQKVYSIGDLRPDLAS